MTNAARKCFIARQSRLTPTVRFYRGFQLHAHFPRTSKIRNARGLAAPEERWRERCSVAGNECNSQRDRRLQPLEILSSSAVNREVGSFASSEVNRALKAATTFSPSTEGCCFLYPSLPDSPLLASCSSMRTGSSSVTLEESNKASRYDAAAGLLRCM